MTKFDLQLAFRSIPVEKDKLDEWALIVLNEIINNCSEPLQIEELICILIGLICSIKVGLTPNISQMSQVATFCKTNGRFQELLLNLFNYTDPMSLAIDSFFFKSVLFDKSINLSKLEISLKKDGYVVWPKLLSSELVDEILQLPKLYPSASVLNINEERFFVNCSSPLRFLNSDCIKLTYKIRNDDTTLNVIAADPVLLYFVRKYLGVKAVLRHAYLDYSFPSAADTASSEAAQLYHFDLDSFQWLKIFIYLNSVNEQNGPHCALLGSHLAGAKPPELLLRGYDRVSDNELIATSQSLPTSFIGYTGSIIIGDTKAYHKGKPLISNYRSMLTLFYSTSLFGYNLGE